MFAYILLLAGQAAAPAPTPQEVVVTARRLKDWRGKASIKAGVSRCRTVKSTGDGELDQIACDSARFCMVKFTPEVEAIAKLRVAERERRFAAINATLARCGEEQQQLRVADLLERRWAARSGQVR